MSRSGSSPRTRGTLGLPARTGAPGRFIPAYTGNSLLPVGCVILAPVHPRVHGELCRRRHSATTSTGSSPRTRGTPSREGIGFRPGRFIPAYTGNSRTTRRRTCTGSVHPRVHGELIGIILLKLFLFGSSPRTRGTLRKAKADYLDDRFIPAYTGNSRCPLLRSTCYSVHPRVHGELRSRTVRMIEMSGSSPRTRGTLIIG